MSNKTGVQIQDTAIANKVTQFVRVEDGAWDPRPGKQRDFYFVTTGRIASDATSLASFASMAAALRQHLTA